MVKKKKEVPKIVLVKSSLFEFDEYRGEVIYTYGRTGDVIIKIIAPVELVNKLPVVLESASNINVIS